ncbi:MAG TPA: hypothetical protein VFY87_23930, partial [Geminicoccaceae bacterium]|nr:hypothetical protein [Geminicoccaceae bacterium]
MTPQSTFMIVAPLADGQEASLRELLASMNGRDGGMADPDNPLVPFGRFDRLHFARFLVIDAPTAGDVAVHGVPPSRWPLSLAFLGDCDGPADTFLAELVAAAGDGLRRIFAHCRGFAPEGDLLRWMRRHEQPSAATYVNWIGRTVVQIREEEALRVALVEHVRGGAVDELRGQPKAMRERLLAFVDAETQAGRLRLTPPGPTPWSWRARDTVHAVGVPLGLLALAPFLVVASPLLVYLLRSRETTDPEITPRPDRDRVRRVAELEDFDVTNQFSAFGDVKPGRFRRWTVTLLLGLLDYGSRHVYNRGNLSRVDTIHFARWVFLDDGRKVLFASNYDGSLESYIDDFINKVAWGINLVFGNGVGFPRVDWMLKGGARYEQKYKRFLRRHQLPTAVWYKAYPGLSVADLNRNTRIR